MFTVAESLNYNYSQESLEMIFIIIIIILYCIENIVHETFITIEKSHKIAVVGSIL